MQKFQKVDQSLFKTLEPEQQAKVLGGAGDPPIESQAVLTVTPEGNKTDQPANPSDGLRPDIFMPPY